MQSRHDENAWRQDIAFRANARKVLAPKQRKADQPHPFRASRPLFLGCIAIAAAALFAALRVGGAV